MCLQLELDSPGPVVVPASHVDVSDAGRESGLPHTDEDVAESDPVEREVSAWGRRRSCDDGIRRLAGTEPCSRHREIVATRYPLRRRSRTG